MLDQCREGGRRQNGARDAAVCGGHGAAGADHRLGRDAAEPDPRTPELRPRGPRSGARCAPRSSATRCWSCPTVDDVYAFERELCAERRGAGRRGDDLRRPLPRGRDRRRRAAGRRALTPAQRLGRRGRGRRRAAPRLGPAARAPPRGPASPRAFERLLDELQGAGLEPAAVEASGRDPRGLGLPRRHRHPLRRLRARCATGSGRSTPTASPARRSRCCGAGGAVLGGGRSSSTASTT